MSENDVDAVLNKWDMVRLGEWMLGSGCWGSGCLNGSTHPPYCVFAGFCALAGNGLLRATVGGSTFNNSEFTLPLPISFAVSGQSPDTEVKFLDTKGGFVISIARLSTASPDDCVMLEERW
jgi:hypothetical protein